MDHVIETEVQNLREGIINFQLDEEDELELGSVPNSPNVSTNNLTGLTSPGMKVLYFLPFFILIFKLII